MAEETHRSSAAEISVTSNGDLDQSPDSVFQRVSAHFGLSDKHGDGDVFRTHKVKMLVSTLSSCNHIYRSLKEKTPPHDVDFL